VDGDYVDVDFGWHIGSTVAGASANACVWRCVMMRVRYPNGQMIQYNRANSLHYKSHAWDLYTADPDEGGSWIASIQTSAGVIVEVVEP